MKKLFSMVLILMLAFTLSACEEENNQDLQAELDALQANYDALVLEKNDLQEEVSELEEQITALQEQIYDNTIIVTMEDEYGMFVSHTVGYDDSYNGTLLDLIEANFEVNVWTSEYGSYLNTIEHLTPQEGTFISIAKNGVPSVVGIDSMSYTNEDVISLEVTWWDTTLQAVDDAIQLFLSEQAEDYVTASMIDYNVLLGLRLLQKETDYVTHEEIVSYVDTLTLNTVQDYFKAIMMKSVAKADITTELAELDNIIAMGPYGQTAYALLAINAETDGNREMSIFEANAVNSFDTTTPYDLGLDAGSISLIALGNYPFQEDLITEFTTWIQESQLPSGGVQTRDIDWGDTVYPGVENAASIAQVIMALVAHDYDPNGTDFTQGENTLVTRLLEFQTETGSFDYDLTDDSSEDLMFSTPQAFLALVVYQQFANTYEAVDPYYFQ